MSIRTDLLNPANVSKATHALLTWTKKSSDSAQLFAEDDDAFVYLNYVLDRAVSQEHVLRFPVRIPGLAHPLYSGENKGKGACLIVGDKKFAKVSELLEANPVDGISRVMSLKEIRLDYQQFKDRRELVSQFDLFLVDYAVREVAAKSMGKIFFSRKKQPYAVRLDLQVSKLHRSLQDALNSTYLSMSGEGNQVSIRVGRLGMSESQLSENVMGVQSELLQHVPRKRRAVDSAHLSVQSMPFPVYVRSTEPVAVKQ